MNIFRNTGCSSGFWPDSCGTPCQECGVPCQNCGNSCCNMGGCPCTPTCPDSIRIGTTITGAPGTEAQVTNSGTAQNPVLNFVIPQGVAGQAGQGRVRKVLRDFRGFRARWGSQGQPAQSVRRGPRAQLVPLVPQDPSARLELAWKL